MIEGLSVLALITARGGSRGLPRKNLREVGGKSLIARAVEAAQGAGTVDRVVLSSEDPEIVQAALLAGCEVPFLRPAELATPDARSNDVVTHALETLPERYDLLVLLQPTSPLRTAADIDGAVRLCVEAGAPACISVTAVDKPPQWTFELDGAGRMVPLMPEQVEAHQRQALAPAYAVNGAVYVARCDWISRRESFLSPDTRGYLMPRERSIDIDDELDLVLAEALLAWSGEAPQPARHAPSMKRQGGAF